MAEGHVVPTHAEYFEVDIYGRASDHVFGAGAAAASALEAKRVLAATLHAKAEIRPQDIIDYDLYGRGDPRVFGVGAETANRVEASRELRANQEQNKHRLRRLMFRSSAKELIKLGFERIRKTSSGSTARRGGRADWPSRPEVSSPRDTPHRVTSRLPSEEVAPHIELGSVDAKVRSFSGIESADDDITIDIGGNFKLPKFDAPSTKIAIDPRALHRDGSRVVDGLRDWTTSSPRGTPHRVMSRLPSEEVAPHIELGNVAAKVRSFSGIENSDDRHRNSQYLKRSVDDITIDICGDFDAPSTKIAIADRVELLVPTSAGLVDKPSGVSSSGNEESMGSSSMEESGESSNIVEEETTSAEESEGVTRESEEQGQDEEVARGAVPATASILASTRRLSNEEMASSTEEDEEEEDSDNVQTETDFIRVDLNIDMGHDGDENGLPVHSRRHHGPVGSDQDREVALDAQEMVSHAINAEARSMAPARLGSAHIAASKPVQNFEGGMSPTTPAHEPRTAFGPEETSADVLGAMESHMGRISSSCQAECDTFFLTRATELSERHDARFELNSPFLEGTHRQKSMADKMVMFNSRHDASQDACNSGSEFPSGIRGGSTPPAIEENMALDEDDLVQQFSYHEVESSMIAPFAIEKGVKFNDPLENDRDVEPSVGGDNVGFWSRLNFFGTNALTKNEEK